MSEPQRCPWAGDHPLMRAYHDEEWGVPRHDDGTLFEFLVLEGAQAGLSWRTILDKREGYRRAFADFDIATVARFTERDVERLLGDAGIVRNRAKVTSAIDNARGALAVQEEFGSLDAYLWSFVDGRALQNAFDGMGDLPASTEVSDRMSRALKKRGFRFVGTTICYSLMQACGFVNDHVTACFRHDEIRRLTA